MSDESDRLKQARELAGHSTAADGARALGMEYPTYAGHENGSRAYDKDDARRYARSFKVNLLWLLYGVGEPRSRSLDQIVGELSEPAQREIEGFIAYKQSQDGK